MRIEKYRETYKIIYRRKPNELFFLWPFVSLHLRCFLAPVRHPENFGSEGSKVAKTRARAAPAGEKNTRFIGRKWGKIPFLAVQNDSQIGPSAVHSVQLSLKSWI